MTKFTIVAEVGDNGKKFAIGLFSSFVVPFAQATEWQDAENPTRDPDGMHYEVVRVQTLAEWKASR